MRPIELQITGLNSFRERQTIQFEPLLAEGLFGIFGPTGSGKSSILDAITLALYGEVKRAPKGKGGIINMREKGCSVSFTFEVLIDGARKRYTIERLIEREKKKGGITTKRARLSMHRDGERIPIAEKEKELDGSPKEPGKIQELIGIGVEDFLRAVILPQGAFANLLNLKPAERGEVMQRLFGLHDLGERLRLQLGERSARIENLRAGQGGRLSELRAFDDDALATALDALREAKTRKESAQQRFDETERSLRETEMLHARLNELAELLDAEPARALQRDELASLRKRIEAAERSRIVEPAIRAAEDTVRRHRDAEERYQAAIAAESIASRRSDEARDRLTSAQSNYDAEYDALGELLIELKRIRATQETLEQHGIELTALKAACERSEDERTKRHEEHQEQIAGVARQEREIEEIERKLSTLRQRPEERERIDRLRLLLQKADGIDAQLGEKRKAVDALRNELSATEKMLDEERKQEMQARENLSILSADNDAARATLATRQTELERHRDQYQQIRNLLSMVGATSQHLAEIKEDLRKKQTETADLEADLHRANITLDSALEARRVIAERMENARERLGNAERDSFLATLAATLNEEEPCPLCGSEHHPRLHRSPSGESQTIDLLRREVSYAERAYKEADEKRSATGEHAARLHSQLTEARKTLLNLETRIAATEREITEQLATADMTSTITSPEELSTYAANLLVLGQSVRGDVDRLRLEQEQLERRISTARDAQHQLENRLTRSAADRANREDRLSSLLAEIETLAGEGAEIAAAMALDSDGVSREAIIEMIARAGTRDRDAAEIEQILSERARKLRMAINARDISAAAFAEADRAHETNAIRARQLSKEIDQRTLGLGTELRALLPPRDHDVPLPLSIRTREERRERLRADFDQARRDYDSAHADTQMKSSEVAGLWKTLCADEIDRDRRTHELTALLRDHGFATTDSARIAFIEENALNGLKENALELDHGLRAAEAREAELRDLIAGRTLPDGRLDEARTAYERAGSERDAAIALHGAAEQRYAMCQEKNLEFQRLLAEQQDVEDQAATIDRLRHYLTGNAFVNYLADERLAEVCRRASFQLESLTGGRLELCSRSSDGFFIRDHGNGSGERATSSLSGGETFLVSLSLALALSDTIQLGKAPLEFFFLDEGFGTLDQDLLDTVLDSLEKLRSHHRAIGVISHVGSLRERINRRLIVSPATDRQGSIVSYEST